MNQEKKAFDTISSSIHLAVKEEEKQINLRKRLKKEEKEREMAEQSARDEKAYDTLLENEDFLVKKISREIERGRKIISIPFEGYEKKEIQRWIEERKLPMSVISRTEFQCGYGIMRTGNILIEEIHIKM